MLDLKFQPITFDLSHRGALHETVKRDHS